MIIILICMAFAIPLLPTYIRYSGSGYKEASGNGFLKTVFNKGNFGEFLTYNSLEKLTGYNRLLTNTYIPKEDGTTTEIDLIMLSESGIYVFESKNYSGWIFGDEKYKKWTQTLPNKQKQSFFNPIWQNKGHINALKSVIGISDDVLYKSYIIFSERCTLKKINVISENVQVIKRDRLLKNIRNDLAKPDKVLSKQNIDGIYKELMTYCLADQRIKMEHIQNIKTKK